MKLSKRGSIVAGVAVASLTAALIPLFSARADTTVPAGTQIKLAGSGKCVNVSGASTDNRAKIIQYTCSGSGTNDRFVLVPKGQSRYWIENVNSGKCLNVDGDSTANNAVIIQYTCSTAYNSLWTVQDQWDKPTIQLVSVRSGKCLNVPGNSTANSTQLIQYTCSASALNDRVFLPPTASATATARPLTTKQPVAVRQTTAGGPITFSWVDDRYHGLLVSTVLDPDAERPADQPSYETTNLYSEYGFTGGPQIAALQNGRPQILTHDGRTGDAVLFEVVQPLKPAPEFLNYDTGGAFDAQPALGPVTSTQLATYVVIDGALWYAPQTRNNAQPPIGGWRPLGGTGLTGTPAVVATADGARIFVRNTAGELLTATLTGTTLSDWAGLGGSGLTGTPAAVALPGGRAVVLVNGSNGVGYLRQNADGSFPATWTSLSGVTRAGSAMTAAGSPSVAYDQVGGRAVAVVRDTAGTVYFTTENVESGGRFDDWLAYSDPAQPAGSDPTVFGYVNPNQAGANGFGVAYLNANPDPAASYPLYYLQDTRSFAKVKPHRLDRVARTVKR